MHLGDLHFIRPAWFAGLIPAALLLLLLWKSRAAQSGWDGLIAPQLLRHLMLGRVQRLGRLPLLVLATAWLLAVVSLAGPTWERQPQPVYRGSLDQVLVLDLSPSMARTDLQPDRVTRARFAISDLIAQSGEGRTALIVFGAEHHVVTPLTDDAPTVEQLLRALTVDVLPVPGDRAASALQASMQLLSAAQSRAMHVILISDGISDPADSISMAVALRQAGAKLSVIGIGSGHESQLRELARSGGGVYQPLGASGVHPALEVKVVADFSAAPGREVKVDLWVEEGVWLLLPLLLLAALGFRRGWLAVLLVVVGQLPQDATALDWGDLWLTPQQQAQRLFENGQTQQAAELFEDPDWRAAAYYRSGEFDKAAADFNNSDAAYNRANALAKAGKLEEALESYDEALSARPDDDDARFNRELVGKLLEQQQQEQGQQQGQQQQQEQEQGQGQESSADSSQRGDAADAPRDESAQPQSGQESAQSAAKTQRSESQNGDEPRADARQAHSTQSRSEQAGTEEQQNEQEQAKKDVDPRSATGRDTQSGALPDDAAHKPVEGPRTEQELALQQWLRQVPDDPGGLLRRKFMLEHVRRQKEQSEP